MRRTLLVIALTAATVACDLGTGPETARWVGVLEVRSASTAADGTTDVLFPVVIDAPDTVTIGVPFTVRVTTYGLSGCWEADGQDLTVEGTEAVITPSDVDTQALDGGPDVCAAVIEPLTHTFDVHFHETGEGVLRVDGRRVRGQDQETAEPLQAEVPITIIPDA